MDDHNNYLSMTIDDHMWQMVIGQVKYKDWKFEIRAHGGPLAKSLTIQFYAEDSTVAAGTSSMPTLLLLNHSFMLPSHHMNAREIEEFIMRSIVQVETHEACERFVSSGVKPFFPVHGNGPGGLYSIRRTIHADL